MTDEQQKQASAPIQLYLTTPYPCSYLPGKMARSQVAIPPQRIDTPTYHFLMRQGFRRSGLVTYRPACQDCHACLSVRLLVDEIHYSRSQQRALKKHNTLHTHLLPLISIPAHIELYQRYQTARHTEADTEQNDSDQYEAFILKSQVDSFLVEFREDNILRMVSLVDQLADGLSAVYTFFDPDIPTASFGVFNILWLAQQAKKQGLPYLYLGYWIANCRKMAYKTDYQPLEGYVNGQWQRLTESDFSPADPD